MPFVDEHRVVIDAPAAAVWENLVHQVSELFGGGLAPRYARAVGCDDQTAGGPRPLAEGSTMPGFHVEIFTPPSELILAGRHRFSTYVLRFRVEPIGTTQSRVCAETRAAFPGFAGGLYRFMVIGTGGHKVAVRRILSRVSRATVARA